MEQVFVHAIVETDAQMVQLQLRQLDSPNSSILGRIYDDMKVLLEDHSNVKVVYMHRSANKAAHLMAAHACAQAQEFFYFSSPFLLDVLAAEATPM